MSGGNGYPNTTKQKGSSGWYSSKRKPESRQLNTTLQLKKHSALAGLTASLKKSMLKSMHENSHPENPKVPGPSQIKRG